MLQWGKDRILGEEGLYFLGGVEMIDYWYLSEAWMLVRPKILQRCFPLSLVGFLGVNSTILAITFSI